MYRNHIFPTFNHSLIHFTSFYNNYIFLCNFRLLFLTSTISSLPLVVRAHGEAGARAAAEAPVPSLQILVGVLVKSVYSVK